MAKLSGLTTALTGTAWSRVLSPRLPVRLKAHVIANLLDQPDPISAVRSAAPADDLARREFSLFSQNGEDGILSYIFNIIGCANRQFLEFGFGARQNNSMRLVLREQFSGIFVDADATTVRCLNHVARIRRLSDVRAVEAFLDRENLAATVLDNGITPGLDLLSIDVDGNDYWFWSLCAPLLRPRVAVVEYNAGLGSESTESVPYDPSFRRFEKHASGFYHGAALGALAVAAESNGYHLIGCDSSGVNAFFVREDCFDERLPHRSVAESYYPHAQRELRGFGVVDQQLVIRSLPLVDVREAANP